MVFLEGGGLVLVQVSLAGLYIYIYDYPIVTIWLVKSLDPGLVLDHKRHLSPPE